MGANSRQQEILLAAGTSFSSRKFRETKDGLNYNHLSEEEKLVISSWNGLLLEILPEIFEQPSVNKKLHLWEMSYGSLFMELKLGEIYLELEKEFSIDPYSFLSMQRLS
jgi:hypothetical protein